ncbi:hypothetical protein NKG94_28290 [Micromonospora sp. M12]
MLREVGVDSDGLDVPGGLSGRLPGREHLDVQLLGVPAGTSLDDYRDQLGTAAPTASGGVARGRTVASPPAPSRAERP